MVITKESYKTNKGYLLHINFKSLHYINIQLSDDKLEAFKESIDFLEKYVPNDYCIAIVLYHVNKPIITYDYNTAKYLSNRLKMAFLQECMNVSME